MPNRDRFIRPTFFVTAALVVVLLVAEATDSLIGNAGFLAVLVALAGLSFWRGFLAADTLWRSRVRACFVCAVGLLAVVGYFGWRETRTVGELARLIEPIPEISDVTYVPTVAEMLVVQAAVAPAASGPSAAFEPTTQRFWLLKTELSEPEALAFCRAAAGRAGWEVESAGEGMLMLERDAERMLIVVAQNWPLPETKVSYVYRGP